MALAIYSEGNISRIKKKLVFLMGIKSKGESM